jgi:hypothetical protein
LRAAPPVDSVVVFNELHYNPGPAGEAVEFIELFNLMGVDVDLSGWRLSAGVDFTFPTGVVIPGGSPLLVAKTPGLFPGALGPYNGQLSNSGETVRLLDNNGRLMDELTYADADEWPAGADGSGFSLAKTDPWRASHDPAQWSFSRVAGGTPGAANFPTARTVDLVDRRASWRHLDPPGSFPSGWELPGFDASTWAEGPGAFHLGSPMLYIDEPAVLHGLWVLQPWTGDADSGLSSTKTYTHAVGFHRAGAYTAINGVTFTSPGPNVRLGADWTLTGAGSGFVNNGNGSGANHLPAGSGSRQLCEEFFYGTTGGLSSLTLSGLTPGQSYAATFYTTAFGNPDGRLTRITASDSGLEFLVDENLRGNGNGLRVVYHYVAPASGSLRFDFTPVNAGATWHHYAFSNEVLPVMPAAAVAATVSSVSSELAGGTFSRAASRTLDGSGLPSSGQTHGTGPENQMWLSRGTFSAPNDPLPAEIAFDLGAVREVSHLRVWNYNELDPNAGNLSNRGAREVEFEVADQAAGPWTPVGTHTFRQASASIAETGEWVPVAWPPTRHVRFRILSNHGDGEQFAGLSEVRFHPQATSLSEAQVPYREPATVFRATGVDAQGSLLAAGATDSHYLNVTGGGSTPVLVQTPHPAWRGGDGRSQWTGPTANGADNIAGGTFVWRTQAMLTAAQAAGGKFQFWFSADNRLNTVSVNGLAHGVYTAGFATELGPYSLTGFQAGTNRVDFAWGNDAAGPGGFRARWAVEVPPADLHGTAWSTPAAPRLLRHTFLWDGQSDSTVRLLLRHAAADGLVLFLNGEEIHRARFSGPLDFSSRADAPLDPVTLSGLHDLPGDALRPGTNVLAAALFPSDGNTDRAFFLLTLSARETPADPTAPPALRLEETGGLAHGAFFVELANRADTSRNLNGWQILSSRGPAFALPAETLAAGERRAWNEGTLGYRPLDGDRLFLLRPGGGLADAVVVGNQPKARDGVGAWRRPVTATPGAANAIAIPDEVVIHEILYHRAPTYLPSGLLENSEEWIELYHRGTQATDLSGWRLRGGADFDFPPGTVLAPGGYLVVASDPAALAALHPHLVPGQNLLGPLSGTLSNSGDTVRLEDALGNPADEVHYLDGGRWPAYADGGGSSLERIHPFADGRIPEAWAPSDESGRSTWQSFEVTGLGAPFPGSSDPTPYHELIFGLVSAGECLIDDVSLVEVDLGNRPCVQNGDFSGGLATWRPRGNHGLHGRTAVVPDPDQPANPVLRLVAAGGMGHMHDLLETTLRSGTDYVTLNSAHTYTLSFRARWLAGTPRLNTRLYFNRLARQHLLPLPAVSGTPGQPNSRAVANAPPGLDDLRQSPVRPAAGESLRVSARVRDADGLAQVRLRWRRDGQTDFAEVPMAARGEEAYEGEIPGQAAGALIQYYVEAEDALGAVGTLPAAGPASRALAEWDDGVAPHGPNQPLRLLMLTADADLLHAATNVMSNLHLPVTVIDRDRDIHPDAALHLRSSQRGRLVDARVGFTVRVDPARPFRGAHRAFNLDRSGFRRGTTDSGHGVSEITTWHFLTQAGGIPALRNDLVHVFAPRPQHSGSAQLMMSDFNDTWFDGRYADGADGAVFKYDFVYYPTTTTGGPEGHKLPNPDQVTRVNFGAIQSPAKEAYRWFFLQENAARADDYSAVVRLNDAFRLTGDAFRAAITNVVDVDAYLRGYAGLTLSGAGDNYNGGIRHNLKLYHRADNRLVFVPWDLDFQSDEATVALVRNADITALLNLGETWRRRFHFHVQDILDRSFNTAYMAPWINHYATFNAAGGNFNDITTYIDARRAHVQGLLNTAYPDQPFAVTTAGGQDFSDPGPVVTLEGTGGLRVAELRILPGGSRPALEWLPGGLWRIRVPIGPGPNALTVQALDSTGLVLAEASLVITGTGSVQPSTAQNLTLSELHYHPAPPTAGEISAGFSDADDFEFLELLNFSPTATVSLAGCRFVTGITHDLPAATLAPGERFVVARRAAALPWRHPGVVVGSEYFQPEGNLLANGGEEIVLVDAQGADIVRLTYGDRWPWPDSPDGGGPSLVRIAPGAGGAGQPWQWRSSLHPHGTPGGHDARPPPADPGGDDNANGLSNLAEYAVGGGAPALAAAWFGGQLRVSWVRDPLASVEWIWEDGPSPLHLLPAPVAPTLLDRTPLADGLERVTVGWTFAPDESRRVYRARLWLAPGG